MARLFDFYQSQTVFITGVTGFLGKVLLEKLLRNLHVVTKVYVLVRPSAKKGVSPKDRLIQEVFGSRAFDALKCSKADALSKVEAISGDVGLPNLGMSDNDYSRLQEAVNLVIHCAATVKFHEHLQEAFRINVDGVRQVLKFCSGVKNLKSIVHVSTAYVAATRMHEKVIADEVYPVQFDHRSLQERVMHLKPEEVDDQTASILESCGGWPNTYTMTKAIAETVIMEEGQHLPIVIVRPTIVGPASQFPYPGWVDTLIGPGGLVLAAAIGVLKVMEGDGEAIVDIVPVDTVVNCLLTACFARGTEFVCGSGQSVPVVTIGTSSSNPMQWNWLIKVMPGYFGRHPSPKSFGPVNFRWVKEKWKLHVLQWFMHRLPAAAMDAKAYMSGSPSKAKNQSRIAALEKAMEALVFFTSHEWVFSSSGASNLVQCLDAADIDTFNFDMSQMIWDTYLTSFSHGLKIYLLKDDPPRWAKSTL